MKRIFGILISAALLLTSFTPICFSSDISLIYEAENANGWTAVTNNDASGDSWARANAGTLGEWSMSIEEDGIYKIEAFYATASDGASVLFEIDDVFSETISFEKTGSNKITSLTSKVLAGECQLTSGNYNFKLTVNDARIFVDYISLVKTGDIPNEPDNTPDEPDNTPDDTSTTLTASEGILGSNAVWNNSAAQLNKNGSISWTLKNDFEEGKYNIEAVFQVNQGERFLTYVNDEKVFTTGYFAPTTTWEKLTRITGEKISLKANDKLTIEIDNVCAILHSIKLIKVEVEDEEEIGDKYVSVDENGTVKVQAEGYYESISEGTSVIKKDNDGFVGYYTLSGMTPVLAYKITVSKTAKYRIIANVKTAHPQWASLYVNDERIAHSLGDFPLEAADFEYGEVTLNADTEYIFKFKNEGATGILYMDYFKIQKADLPLKVTSVFAEKEEINDDNNIIKRGTDYFDIIFSDNIDVSSVTSENVSIAGETKNIEFDCEITGPVLRLKLKETLDYEKTYFIKFGNIKSTYGTLIDKEYNIKIITDVSSSDYGQDSASVTEKSIVYDDVTVKGVVTSGIGVPIKGRKVTLYAKSENNEEIVFSGAEAISSDNGEYIINATILSDSSDELCGKVTFEVKSEYYASVSSFDLPYYSKTKEESILSDLSDSADSSDVEEIFINNQTSLGLSVTNDINKLNDKTSFFASFTNKNFDSLKNLKDAYKKTYTGFIINEADDINDIDTVFLNEDYTAAFCTDIQMYKEIINNKNSLLNEILSFDIESDINLLSEKTNLAIKKNFLKEYNKKALKPLAENKSVYIGQTVDIEAGISEAASDIKDFEMILKSDNALLFSNVRSDGNHIINSDNTNITYKKSHDKTDTVKLGVISFTAPKTPSIFKIKISGNAVYEITAESGKIYTVTDEISEKEITLSVSNPSQASPSHSSVSSGGGGSSSVSPQKPQKPENETNIENSENNENNKDEAEKEKAEYKFSDLSSYSWAEESIYYLLSSDVVSESPDKLFNPSQNVTRAEFIKMLVSAFGLTDKNAKADFTDVNSQDWFYPYVASAVKYGIVIGNSDGSFGSDFMITRQDMAVMIERVLEKMGYTDENIKADLFSDYDDISDYAKKAVLNMQSLGVLNGMGNNLFMPKSPATRAQAAKVIYMLMKLNNR